MNKQYLEDPPIYPGHPVAIAYQIMCLYSSLEEASEIGTNFPKALEDTRVSGAGGRVSAALSLLKNRERGESWEKLFSWADYVWNTEKRRDHKEGQEQANRIKEILKTMKWSGQESGSEKRDGPVADC